MTKTKTLRMKWLATSALFLSVAAVPACAAPAADGIAEGEEQEATVATAAQAIVVPAWRGFWDYQGVDLDAVTNTARTDGYRPVSISAHGTAAAPRFSVVFVKRAGAAYKVVRGTGLAAFQTAFDANAALRYKPTLLSFDGDASNPVWAAVFEATAGGIPYTRSALTSGAVSDAGTIEHWLNKARTEHLIPTTLTLYGTAASPRYAIVLEANTANVDWTVGNIGTWNGQWTGSGQNDTYAEYQAHVDAQVPAGNRPSIVDLNGDQRVLSMFRADSVGGVVGRHGLTFQGLTDEVATQKAAGRFPIYVSGGGAGASTRYAALFAQIDTPLPRIFTPTGSGKAYDPAIAAVDDVMKGFMDRNDVRQASLAVLDGKKLVYARGYTDAEAGYRTTDATTHFRMASVSKVVTGMEIMRLIDRNQLKLDDKVQDILALTTYDGSTLEPLFKTITIKHLLTHNFPTLTAADGTLRCLRRDADVSQYAATALGVSLPLTTAQAVKYSMSRNVVRVKGKDSCYSNLGYTLLGMVVEKKRGVTLTSALQSDLFSPLGITRFRVASSNVNAQPANEALYRGDGLWTTANVNVPGTPLAAVPYGGDNFQALLAPGGMSMAATDMARLLAMLNVPGTHPVFNDTTALDGDPATIDQLLSGPYGFEGSSGDANGTHYYKGGYLSGLQSTVFFTRNGLSYVLFWARNEVESKFTGAASDDWWPSWSALETALRNANLSAPAPARVRDARTDLFPTYGMPSL